MSHKQAEELVELYRNWVAMRSENPAMSLEDLRDMVEHWEAVTGEPGTSITSKPMPAPYKRCGRSEGAR